MPIDMHTIEAGAGSTFAFSDRVKIWNLPGVATAAAGGEGDNVTTAISFPNVDLPAAYSVLVGGISQDATAYVTEKTDSGFNVILVPPSSSVTLAAGTLDAVVIG
jgi:hypothetical protein